MCGGIEIEGTKHRLEFFPEVVFTIPETVGGSCCLKPIAKQTERSREMLRFARHLQWQNRDKIELTIPSKSESRIRSIVKWRKFRARLKLWRLGIKKLPALVLDGKVLCQGELNLDYEFEKIS